VFASSVSAAALNRLSSREDGDAGRHIDDDAPKVPPLRWDALCVLLA
jgi:hypothetical protein